MQQEIRNFVADFYGEKNCSQSEETCSEDDYIEAVAMYEDMLSDAINRGDKNEIALCRRELQEAKCELRSFKAA